MEKEGQHTISSELMYSVSNEPLTPSQMQIFEEIKTARTTSDHDTVRQVTETSTGLTPRVPEPQTNKWNIVSTRDIKLGTHT